MPNLAQQVLANLPVKKHGTKYGFPYILASYAKRAKALAPLAGEIPHGWICPERNITPDFVVGTDGLAHTRPNRRLFVAREDQSLFLKHNGFSSVHAIGHALIYLEKPSLLRIPSSLLVMPPHADPSQDESFDDLDKAYAAYIRSISDQFELVCLCINSYDYHHGLWSALRSVVRFNVEGADYSDDNAGLRIASLFSQFEYMTTCEFGSHVAYASLFGCKVSVAGPTLDFKKNKYQNIGFYKNCPELLDIYHEWHQTSFLERKYNFFCCHPKDAVINIEWAEWQLGLQCKKVPSELCNLMRWNFFGLLAHYLSCIRQQILHQLVYIKNKIN
jgi:hypothetical protein